MHVTKRRVRLTPRNKAILAEVRASGELLVIEDDWLVYKSESQTCPFGLGRTQNEVEIVRENLKRLDVDAVLAYRRKRNEKAQEFAELAINAIRSGNYELAETQLRHAGRFQLTSNTSIALYSFEDGEQCST